jgi:hypothetical protein
VKWGLWHLDFYTFGVYGLYLRYIKIIPSALMDIILRPNSGPRICLFVSAIPQTSSMVSVWILVSSSLAQADTFYMQRAK